MRSLSSRLLRSLTTSSRSSDDHRSPPVQYKRRSQRSAVMAAAALGSTKRQVGELVRRTITDLVNVTENSEDENIVTESVQAF